MKARWTVVVAITFVGVLSSCQQAYVDKQARSSNDPLFSPLSAPSFGPGDAANYSGAIDVDATTAPLLWKVVEPVITSISPNATLAPTVTPGSGLSGYTPVWPTTDQTSYQTSVSSGSTNNSNNGVSAGDGTTTEQTYQEESAAHHQYQAASLIAQFFKKAYHRFLLRSKTHNLSYSDATGLVISGKDSLTNHSEWYKDINETPITTNKYFVYTGTSAVSLGSVFTATAPVPVGGTTPTVGAKFVLSGTASKNYSTTDLTTSLVGVSVTVNVYDNSNKLVFSTELSGTSDLADDGK